MGGGGGTDQLLQEIREQRMEQGQHRIPAGLAANDGGTIGSEGIGIKVGIKTTGAMPKHCLLAILGVFEIDAVMD